MNLRVSCCYSWIFFYSEFSYKWEHSPTQPGCNSQNWEMCYCHLILWPYSGVSSCLLISIIVKESSSEWCTASSCFLHLFLSRRGPWFSLTLMILTALKIPAQLFCRVSLHLVLSYVFSRLGSGYASLSGISQNWCCVLIASYQVTHDFDLFN